MRFETRSQPSILPMSHFDQTSILDELIQKTSANIAETRPNIFDKNVENQNYSFEYFVEHLLQNPLLSSENVDVDDKNNSFESGFLPDTPPMIRESPASSSFSKVNPSLAILRALSGTDPTNGQMTAAAARVVLNSKEMSRHMNDEIHNELLAMASSHPGKTSNNPPNELLNKTLNKPLNTPKNTSVDTPLNTRLNTDLNTRLNTDLNTRLNTDLNTRLNAPLNILFYKPSYTPSNTPVDTSFNTPLNNKPSDTVLDTCLNVDARLNMESSILSESERRELTALRELKELEELKESREWKELQELRRLKTLEELQELKKWKELQEFEQVQEAQGLSYLGTDGDTPMDMEEEDLTKTYFLQNEPMGFSLMEEFSRMDYEYFPTGLLEDVVYMGWKR